MGLFPVGLAGPLARHSAGSVLCQPRYPQLESSTEHGEAEPSRQHQARTGPFADRIGAAHARDRGRRHHRPRRRHSRRHGGLFIAAAELIRAVKGRVIVTGMGKSGHVARKVAATLASTGTPAFFVHPGEASHGDLGMITPDDAIMALSWSGETAELKDLIDYSRRFRIGLVAITADAASTLAKAADVALVLPQAREACPHNLAPTTSSLMQLALGDALAIALLESRGFTPVDFGLLHPGGRLGALLKFTRDIMHSGDLGAARPARHQDVGCGAGNVGQGPRLRRHHRRRRQSHRHRHGRRSPPPHARRSAQRPGRRHHDPFAQDDPSGSACERGAGSAQFDRRSPHCSLSMPDGRSGSCISTICCAPARPRTPEIGARSHRCACSMSSPRTGISCPIACRWRARRATRASRFMWRRGWLTAPPQSAPKASCCIRCLSCAAASRHSAPSPRSARCGTFTASIAPDIVHHVALQATILGSIAAAGLAGEQRERADRARLHLHLGQCQGNAAAADPQRAASPAAQPPEAVGPGAKSR